MEMKKISAFGWRPPQSFHGQEIKEGKVQVVENPNAKEQGATNEQRMLAFGLGLPRKPDCDRRGEQHRQNQVGQPGDAEGGRVDQRPKRLAGDRQEGDRQQHQVRPPAALYAEHERDQPHHHAEVVHAVDPVEFAEFNQPDQHHVDRQKQPDQPAGQRADIRLGRDADAPPVQPQAKAKHRTHHRTKGGLHHVPPVEIFCEKADETFVVHPGVPRVAGL